MKPFIAITSGDFNGIGPEITLKSILSPSVQKICRPVLVGSLDIFETYARRLQRKIILQEIEALSLANTTHGIPVIQIRKYHHPNIRPGTLSKEAGLYAGEAIVKAAHLCLQQNVDGMVTAPVSKETMRLAGFNTPGQTEMLAKISKAKRFGMMLIAGKLRVGLATVHLPIKRVADSISRTLLLNKLELIHSTLKKDFGIRAPKIAVLGLNPHAGEHGLIGKEEVQIIIPAIRSAVLKHIHSEGPFPADAFFGRHLYNQYDAVLAMYHDQGLIPLKLKGFDIGVNYTAGLPIVRTSPDHGTAFDIAGKGVANPGSMIEAIKLAVNIVHNRMKKR